MLVIIANRWDNICMIKTSKKAIAKTSENNNAIVEKNKIGRPVKYKTVEQLQVVLDEYFEVHNTVDNPPLMSGLALELGLSRQGLLEYSRKDLFSDAIKRARQMVEVMNEHMLLTKKTSPIGNIFNLKNNFGWRDDKILVVEHKNIASIMASEVGNNEAIEGELIEEEESEQLFLA